MGYRTKIDWCDSTWNPVTGCLHDCEYCYARGIAHRYGGYNIDPVGESTLIGTRPDGTKIVVLEHQLSRIDKNDVVRHAAYPYEFTPTLHRYRLDKPSKWSEPRTIFVCSMADLFGDWVPDSWIEEVINACLAASQHRYIFLTKNPARYLSLIDNGIIPERQWNFWLGSTATSPDMEFFYCGVANTFISIEPMLAPFEDLTDEGQSPASLVDWIIVGAETGGRKNKVVPKREWISELMECARKSDTPIFMKESLREIMGDDFIQQFPWDKPLLSGFADNDTAQYADNPTV